MKKIYTLLFALLISAGAQAQIKLGVKGGLNYPQYTPNAQDLIAIYNDPALLIDSINTSVDNGYHFGGVLRIKLPFVYLHGEALYTHYTKTITVVENGISTDLISPVHRLDLPVTVGTKLGPFYTGLGGVPSIPFANAGDIFNDSTQANFTWGWHAVVGIKLGNLMLEGKYEGGFGMFAQDVSTDYNGQTYNFSLDARENQATLSLIYLL